MTNTSVRDWLAMPIDERTERARQAITSAREAKRSHGIFISVVEDDTPIPGGGALAAIPYSVKDNIDVAGLPTTGGSPVLEGSVPQIDASVISALRSEGAVAIGKSNLHEFAFGTTSNNGHFGPVRNPHDPARTAGGSSGGSAASVALGTVPFGIGTDTGASVVAPAALCGIVGYRPSTGRYLGDGVIHLCWTRDTIGLHANTVDDIRLLDGIIARRAPAPGPSPKVTNLRLGVARSRLEDLETAVAAATEEALRRLSGAGVTLIDVDVPDATKLNDEGFPMVFFETYRNILDYFAHLAPEFAGLSFRQIAERTGSPDVTDIFRQIAAREVTPAQYAAASQSRNELRARYQRTFAESGVDALVFPTVPYLAPELGNELTIVYDGMERDLFPTAVRNVGPGGLAGAPQVSLPVTRPQGALPVGLTVEGPIGGDEPTLVLADVLSGLI